MDAFLAIIRQQDLELWVSVCQTLDLSRWIRIEILLLGAARTVPDLLSRYAFFRKRSPSLRAEWAWSIRRPKADGGGDAPPRGVSISGSSVDRCCPISLAPCYHHDTSFVYCTFWGFVLKPLLLMGQAWPHWFVFACSERIFNLFGMVNALDVPASTDAVGAFGKSCAICLYIVLYMLARVLGSTYLPKCKRLGSRFSSPPLTIRTVVKPKKAKRSFE